MITSKIQPIQRISNLGIRLSVLREAIQRFYSLHPNPLDKKIMDVFVLDTIILLRKAKNERTLRGISDEDIFKYLKGL